MGHELTDAQYNSQVSAVWKATFWLTFITIIEVVAAYWYAWQYPIDPVTGEGTGPRMLLNIFFILASLLKAYFIVGEFMHVRYETRALALTILVPTLFLVWFIIAFMWEGAEWLAIREYWEMVIPTEPTGDHGGGHH